MPTVHIGLTYPDLIAHIAPGDLAERAERWGFHTLWVTDHALTSRLDPLVLLAAVSQRTRRLRLGTGVLALPYRTPYLTAKAAASLDRTLGGARHARSGHRRSLPRVRRARTRSPGARPAL